MKAAVQPLSKTSIQPITSFDQKYSFKKSNVRMTYHNKRTVLYNQNQNFKAKYVLSKNQTSKRASAVNKNTFQSNILNNNLLTENKKSIGNSENKFDRTSCISSNESGKLTSNTKDFIKEIESLTALLKKKSASNQPKLPSSTAKYDNVIQDKLLHHKNYQYSAFNNFKSVKNENIVSKTEHLVKMSSKVMTGNTKSSVNNGKINNCYTKVNSNNRSNPHQLKTLIPNKLCYKIVDGKETLNSKATSTFFKTFKNMEQSKNKFQKITSSPHSQKVFFSDFKNASDNLCVSGNASVFTSKPLSPSKQELIFTTNKSVPSCNKVSKEFLISEVKASSLLKMKSPSVFKSAKVIKLKSGGARYTKINKHLTIPNKTLQLKYSGHQKTSFSKKTKSSLNSKYKVINKTLTPCANKMIVNSSSLGSKESSLIAVDSDLFLRDLNDSAIDKLEKNLLALSTELTSTPVSGKCEVNNNQIPHSLAKVNSKLCFKKTPLKKSKARISKYKIINSEVHQNYSLKKKQNLANLKTGSKKIKHSKFSLINKYIQPVHVLTPVRQQKSVLVKRLFKSKSAIINKNASPISYSAKMIKSKYLTLNKRKLHSWQKSNIFPRVPLHHPKFKGYSSMAKLHSKQNRYQKTVITAYHPRFSRKFTSYSCQTSNKQFAKNSSGKRCKRKVNNGYVRSPVIFIHGMRYSLNSSGKTLKKLPIKGQTAKTFRSIGSKVLLRTPENSVKTLTPTSTNLASRVLHRSINRILTASSKKSLTKMNTHCMFYNRFGRCNRGVKCTYIHDPSKIAVCTRFLRGTCKIDGCPFSHEIAPGKMAICSFFLVGLCEKENCPYRHEKLSPDAVLCKAFVQGYCPNGKECKKAHILICPKYMQGNCEKGSSCAFPHPPQKVKKNVQKEVEDEEKKPSDILLEKVFRYFQEGGDCILPLENKSVENNTANLFVPKRRKLEEQPSFIPLCDSPSTLQNS